MATPEINILVVDDDVELLAVLEESLSLSPEHRVRGSNAGREAMDLLAGEKFDVLLTDYSLGDETINGLTLLRKARELQPSILGIVITAFASLEISIDAIRLGAYDFLTKPFQIDEVQLAVRNAVDRVRLMRENDRLRAESSELAESLRKIEEEYQGLMNQLRTMRDRSTQLVSLGTSHSTAYHRDQSKQIQAYLKTGESIGQKLKRENERLKQLADLGIEPPKSDPT